MKDKEKQIIEKAIDILYDIDDFYKGLAREELENKIKRGNYYDIVKLVKLGYQKLPEDSVSTSKEKVFDILNRMEFFQGQRAGRELWNDKPKEVQDKDISDFVKGIKYIRSYLKDSVVLSREEIDSAEYFYVQDGELKLIEKGRGKFITKEWYTELLMKMPLAHELAKERKETAEKFLQLAYDRCLEKSFIKKVEELAKQFGIKTKG